MPTPFVEIGATQAKLMCAWNEIYLIHKKIAAVRRGTKS